MKKHLIILVIFSAICGEIGAQNNLKFSAFARNVTLLNSDFSGGKTSVNLLACGVSINKGKILADLGFAGNDKFYNVHTIGQYNLLSKNGFLINTFCEGAYFPKTKKMVLFTGVNVMPVVKTSWGKVTFPLIVGLNSEKVFQARFIVNLAVDL